MAQLAPECDGQSQPEWPIWKNWNEVCLRLTQVLTGTPFYSVLWAKTNDRAVLDEFRVE